jgi:dihydroorotate dehydrogenase
MASYKLVRPFLHLLSPETAHGVVIAALKRGLGGKAWFYDEEIFRTELWGLQFPNPIGLAAGFDKNAEVPDAMLDLGFGFAECGSVTPRPQPGNPQPRLFRLDEDEAVINRLGFNSKGLDYFAHNLESRRRAGIVGANLGKNRDTVNAADDYVAGVKRVCAYADYLVCNVSSPNTPGLRSLQARNEIEDLISRVLEARRESAPDPQRMPPLLAKVGPDLDDAQILDIAEVALATRIDGLIIGNTTVTRPPSLTSRDAKESGGLSGKPLMPLATQCLAAMYRATGGRIPLIGCGGVATGEDAYLKIRAGASLVQLYSALVFHGPEQVLLIKRKLGAFVRADGFKSVTEAVGADHR